MENAILKFVFDRKGITKKDASKKGLVQIEIYDRNTFRRAYISTGLKLKKNQFSPNGGLSVKNHPNASLLKSNAHSLFNKVEAFVLSAKCNSFDDIKNWNKDDEVLTTSVFDFIREDLRRRNVSYSILEYNNSFLKRLEEFGNIKSFFITACCRKNC